MWNKVMEEKAVVEKQNSKKGLKKQKHGSSFFSAWNDIQSSQRDLWINEK